jgi:hypothetical protein
VNARLTQITSRWWFKVGAVWLTTRVATFALFLVAASLQGDNYWTKAQPGYFDFLNIWDVEWYGRIFDHGYPTALPITANGNVAQNEWAFMPLFPFVARALSVVTGLEWRFAAPLLATVASFFAAAMILKLFTRLMTEREALWGVGLVGLWCASPVLQTGYAESLGLVFLAWALILIHDRRYLLSLLPIALLTFTRPGSLALALTLVLIWLVKFVAERRGGESFAKAQKLQLGLAAAAASVIGFAWMLTAWLFTGRPDAYLATELAWRAGYLGEHRLTPFEGWFASFNFYFGQPIGVFALVALILAAGYLLTWPSVRALGSSYIWVIAYFVYLLAVFFPQSSTWRILLPAFPLLGALAGPVSRSNRVVQVFLVASLLALQTWWLLTCWNYSAPDFTPP